MTKPRKRTIFLKLKQWARCLCDRIHFCFFNQHCGAPPLLIFVMKTFVNELAFELLWGVFFWICMCLMWEWAHRKLTIHATENDGAVNDISCEVDILNGSRKFYILWLFSSQWFQCSFISTFLRDTRSSSWNSSSVYHSSYC